MYRAVRNFKFGRLVVSVGDTYSGGDVENLMRLGLLEKISTPAEVDPVAAPQEAKADSVPVPPVQQEKKAKRKKG